MNRHVDDSAFVFRVNEEFFEFLLFRQISNLLVNNTVIAIVAS